TSNRAKVFVYGMRNPFRFDFHPETGKLFVADVGNNKWEEITIAEPGDNLGWPCYEGPEQTGISPTCGGLYTGKEHRRPTYAYPHADGRGAAIGGAFYTGDNFPARYRNAFFYGDFNASTIDVLTFADDGTPVSTPFATNAVAPVRMATGPDGALYVLFIADGTLRRIRYTGGGGDDGAPSVALAAPL
ncbi:MAG: PQQ-dependent sugar dehydrogenase, partial [Caldilinea sp.]|nr:PQQ-dependent sugar dehydrogenase [Caldilinea sp.]